MAVCLYCEERVNRYSPDVVSFHHDPDGHVAHKRCLEEADLRRYKRDAESELVRLRERVRALEAQVAATHQ